MKTGVISYVNELLNDNTINNTDYIDPNVTTFCGGEYKVRIDRDLSKYPTILLVQNFFDANNDIIKFIITVNAIENAGSKNIVAFIPYMAYARQDRMISNYESVAILPIFKLLTCNSSVSKILTLDIHNPSILSFNSKIINILPTSIFANYIKNNFKLFGLLLVSPDQGSLQRVRVIANILNVKSACMKKLRHDNTIEVSCDFQCNSMVCIIIDDIVASGSTIGKAADLLVQNGAKSVNVMCSHFISACFDINNAINLKLIAASNADRYPSYLKKIPLAVSELISESM